MFTSSRIFVSLFGPERLDLDLETLLRFGFLISELYSLVFFTMFQTIALVGESGSGKSTVIALLQRFYDPDSGQITLDGVEIKTLQLKWLRQQTGLVSQEPVLFNETIRANIAYGKGGDASETEIVSAAELSNAHGFISGLQQVTLSAPNRNSQT